MASELYLFEEIKQEYQRKVPCKPFIIGYCTAVFIPSKSLLAALKQRTGNDWEHYSMKSFRADPNVVEVAKELGNSAAKQGKIYYLQIPLTNS